ncbi:MAG: RluA family pseudouridine synthase [Candidatus Omnitrophica bacterium]|nr:RluA family pseudouridine synthase [Candidatus Omnitrophota bacterium]
MKKIEFKISDEDAGTRIDKCITRKLGEEYSRTYVKSLIDNKLVRVNGENIKAHYVAHKNDEVVAEMLPLEVQDVEPEDIPLDIIYEDEWLIVINKSAGMVVHPGSGNRTGTLVGALLYHCGKLPEADDDDRPGIVHRLDKDTSGVMVVAKNPRSLRSLSKQFQNRTIQKTYIALVQGSLELDNGIIEAPLARDAFDRKKMSVEYAAGKEARTVYHVIKRFGKFTFVRLNPKTGRTHQIRVHMKFLGHIILGDAKYGCSKGMARQALHAESIIFCHPGTGKTMTFSAPIPEDIKEVIARGDI